MNTTHWGKKALVLFIFAFIGWGLCGAIIGIGRQATSMQNTLILHAIGVPIIFTTLSLIYFRLFNYTSPMLTAILFLTFAIGMDFFFVAMLVEKSFTMFSSILGVWIPFGLIFASTYVTGYLVTHRSTPVQATAGRS